ncbi:dihydrolipoamide acetyltransferase family protein [Microbulbifer rhizosphaerae]|uniref:Dihydrolipoamide acetyltransferase component of pyruvate dehydrogenase complex n=1 Tax=Microbulbifer rhizosphaerae TaxID=1562603 RepID=A0A7W4WD68_9GAMM|nr:dihydrolipoamide acetyltransferase family protein [Microbulbifer rhizosphaerae]MBB3061568.1 pyruvate dehydrogenase E2 component (dihydrolipoamide acetyltransferase) [Microbulbifer rhizosphaerae]
MKIFKLPDLGEGLQDAVIREWHVAEGETVAVNQGLVTVETAKALVDVPSPWSGTVEKLYAAKDDTIDVGQPLVGFVEEKAEQSTSVGAAVGRDQPPSEEKPSDAGTVVGRIQQSGQTLGEETAPRTPVHRTATPAVRALARRLGVDLSQHQPQGERFTADEVRELAERKPKQEKEKKRPGKAPAKEASPARRAMALAMSRARDQVAPMTLCDQVDISPWWGEQSATLRLIRAVQEASAAEPNLNALYENDSLSPSETVNIGLAVDSPRGLYVPVLRDVAARSDEELLEQIEDYKEQARETGIAREDLQGATILLSNFGGMAGRYATPVVLPPTVAILGAGRVFQGVVAVDDKPAVRSLLPLSVSADHRAVTGGELARFLKALMRALAG